MDDKMRQTQEHFSRLVMSADLDSVPDLFSTEAELIERRLAIYRGNVQSIWTKTLLNTFPVLQQLVGDEFFTYLALQYGRQFPSQSGDLNQFGSQFSSYLSIEAAVKDYPYFPTVAALEWQLHCAYYAENIELISLPQFLSCVGDSVQSSRLLFHPAASLFQSSYAAAQVYLAHQEQPIRAIDVPLDTSCYALASRPKWRVELTLLDAASFRALQALQQGEILGDALEQAMSVDSQFDIASQLQKWFALGVFIGFECKE
ncbi:putative DNA-binding domain-containing protein [Undibacterium sp. Di24W]|uniref:HvfC/BufC family peptide modification chaperone n=1 Tax=Undibacterium sp. Di24W TaxID=3413033 RepID=UPI003BF33C69